MSSNLYADIVEAIDGRSAFATALVLSTTGSTPGRPGMRAIVDRSGRLRHTIGGGLMEATVQRQAVASLRAGTAAVIDFSMDGPGNGDGQPICGGRMRILVDPAPAKARRAYALADSALAQRRRGVLLTMLRGEHPPDVEVIWLPDSDAAAPPDFPGGDALAETLAEAEPRYVSQPEPADTPHLAAFLEPVIPKPLLVIFGAGHVSQALARQANLLGFEIGVVDDRPEFVQPSLFPEGTRLCCGDAAGAGRQFPFNQDTYLVLVGRGYQQDLEALAEFIHEPVGYLGMIGSERKVALVRRDLMASLRATRAELDRVHAPVGIDIGAVTVQEIAVSIAAELVSVRHARRPPQRPMTTGAASEAPA